MTWRIYENGYDPCHPWSAQWDQTYDGYDVFATKAEARAYADANPDGAPQGTEVATQPSRDVTDPARVGTGTIRILPVAFKHFDEEPDQDDESDDALTVDDIWTITRPARRVLITGSRYWIDRQRIWQALDNATRGLEPGQVTVVHGDCPTGADQYADQWAQARGATLERHPADWNRHGKAAGPLRNQQMVNLGADLCLAFLLAGSRGTKDCIRKALDARIAVHIERPSA